MLEGSSTKMDAEIMARFNSFSLSEKEAENVKLSEVDVCIGLEEGNRSLIGRIFGEKSANFIGVKNAMMKIWQHRGLCKVISLTQNVYQFVFKEAGDREMVMQGRPWLIDNFLLVLNQWKEDLKWTDECFNFSPMWIQVWHLPNHWSSIESGRKIGNKLGEVKDIRLMESGGNEEQSMKILAVIDLTKPLQRGTKLKYRQSDCWVEFRYEQLPIFCFYCGHIGHNDCLCLKRGKDLECGRVSNDQFGYWLKAGTRKPVGWRGRQGNLTLEQVGPTILKGAQELKHIARDPEVKGVRVQEKGETGNPRVKSSGTEGVCGLQVDKSGEAENIMELESQEHEKDKLLIRTKVTERERRGYRSASSQEGDWPVLDGGEA